MEKFIAATPRPWQSVKFHGSENDYHIFSQPDKSVMYQSVCSANKIDADLILVAVNNFDKMKEALEGMCKYWEWSIKDPNFEEYRKAKQLLESIK